MRDNEHAELLGKLLTSGEVVEATNGALSKSKLEHDRASGKIAYYRIGKRSFFKPEDVATYLEAHRRPIGRRLPERRPAAAKPLASVDRPASPGPDERSLA